MKRHYRRDIDDVDNEPEENRFVALGIGSMGRVLVVVYVARDEGIRMISARRATRQEWSQYESRRKMKRQYDFSKARRDPVVPSSPGKTRVAIRLDNDVIERFQATVDRAAERKSQAVKVAELLLLPFGTLVTSTKAESDAIRGAAWFSGNSRSLVSRIKKYSQVMSTKCR